MADVADLTEEVTSHHIAMERHERENRPKLMALAAYGGVTVVLLAILLELREINEKLTD